MPDKKMILRSVLLALLFFAVLRSPAQQQVMSANRWLIVVDTSSSMGTRAEATVASIQAMLLSGMNNELRPGDTIGLWTFNQSLMTGRFPLQLWHPEAAQTIAATAADFLKKQTYEKTARFDCVIPPVNRLVTNSDILTVILLTDGGEQIKGTPFDTQINATIKKDFSHQKKIHAPFVLVLRSMGGKITDYSVTLPPWLASFPPLPPVPAIVLKEELPAPAPAPVVPSIIMSGKKSDITTNEPAPFTPPAQVVPPITLNPEPVASLAPEPAPAPVATQAVEAVSEIVTSTPPPPENVTAQTTPQIPDSAPVAVVETPPHPEPMPSEPTTETPVKPLEAPAIAPLPAAQTSVAITDTKENISSTPTIMTQAVAVPVPTASTPETHAPVQPAAVVPPTTGSGTQTRLLLGIGLVVIALGIGIFWLRGSRPATGGSLITRSIDDDKRDS